jgi:CspA family cold shock protein
VGGEALSLRLSRERKAERRVAMLWLPGGLCKFWGDVSMASGNVKWFNETKGYGFIKPDDGSNDVFVHISAVQDAGLKTLIEGQKLEYDVGPGRNGKHAASNLKVTR